MAITNVFREKVRHPSETNPVKWITMRDVVTGVITEQRSEKKGYDLDSTEIITAYEFQDNLTTKTYNYLISYDTIRANILTIQNIELSEYDYLVSKNDFNISNFEVTNFSWEDHPTDKNISFTVECRIESPDVDKAFDDGSVSIEGFFSIEVNCTYSYVTDKKTIRYYDGEENLLNIGSELAPAYIKDGEFKSIDVNLNNLDLLSFGEDNIDESIVVGEGKTISIGNINGVNINELKEIAFTDENNADSNVWRIVEEAENNG